MRIRVDLGGFGHRKTNEPWRFSEKELAAAWGWESGRAQIHGDRARLLEPEGREERKLMVLPPLLLPPAQKCRGSEAGGVGRSVFSVERVGKSEI
jgi:hypothetical protein